MPDAVAEARTKLMFIASKCTTMAVMSLGAGDNNLARVFALLSEDILSVNQKLGTLEGCPAETTPTTAQAEALTGQPSPPDSPTSPAV